MTLRIRAIGQRLRHVVDSKSLLLGQTGWVAASFGVQQGLRLALNIVLAWMLAPELFGIMLLLNTFRTGAELLSDIGIGQNIVRNPKGEDQEFLNTAWVLQIGRGVLLFAITLAATVPIAKLYDNPQLNVLLPMTGLLFLILGLQAPSRSVLEKRMDLKRITLLELVLGLISVAVHVALAWYTPTIWALVLALLILAPIDLLSSFLLLPKAKWRFTFNREYAREILSFGKWIFVSSFIFFLALNFDRLYFAGAVSAVTLGVYGIARTYADTVVMLVQRFSKLIIFPKISASGQRGTELRTSIAGMRKVSLALIAVGLALMVVLADAAIYLVYDDRYRDVATYLPILLIGTWFTVLATFAEGMMLGVGRSSSLAYSNGIKLAWIVVTLPLSLNHFGIQAAPFAFILGDGVRYLALIWMKRREGLSFVRQDVALTLLFIAAILVFRELSSLVGLTSGISGWLAAFASLGR